MSLGAVPEGVYDLATGAPMKNDPAYDIASALDTSDTYMVLRKGARGATYAEPTRPEDDPTYMSLDSAKKGIYDLATGKPNKREKPYDLATGGGRDRSFIPPTVGAKGVYSLATDKHDPTYMALGSGEEGIYDIATGAHVRGRVRLGHWRH